MHAAKPRGLLIGLPSEADAGRGVRECLLLQSGDRAQARGIRAAANIRIINPLDAYARSDRETAHRDSVLNEEREGIAFRATITLCAGRAGIGKGRAAIVGLRVDILPLEAIDEILMETESGLDAM